MLLSMTGFGKSVVELSNKKITVEIKSLNSKQMDLSVRMPSPFRTLELPVRSLVAQKLERGKVELNISVEYISDADVTSSLNVEAMRNYKLQILEASRSLKIGVPVDWWSVMLRMPDVMGSNVDNEASADDAEAINTAVESAIKALTDYRRAEGIKLEGFFNARIAEIQTLLANVAIYENERLARIRERLSDGLAKVPVADYDKGRLEQEMIFYIEKLDINEEKQRLSQHLSYFLETMNQPQGGQGKKLGFIAQEMGREINTLGSKSNHAEMQKLVVRMKDQLEQIKEQVLNVL